MSVDIGDLEILDLLRNFTLQHPHADIERFKAAMRDWGDDWIERAPAYLPAADQLDKIPAPAGHRDLLQAFAAQRQRLCWEQSYRREDGLVPDAMLDGYAFAEIIGKRGPFVSERIRAGIGIWGPRIDYPRHHHQAEEIYLVLAGSAEFRVGDGAAVRRTAGDVVFVSSNTPHGFTTVDEGLIVFYLWQAGDLRQTSTFE